MDVNATFDELTVLIPIFGAGFGAGNVNRTRNMVCW